MGGLQKQHNPWLSRGELLHRTPISNTMRSITERRVAEQTGFTLGSFVLANEMIVPFTHRYSEEGAAGLIWQLSARMKGLVEAGRDDFNVYCPGFAVTNPEVPLTGSAISRPAIIGFTQDLEVKSTLIDATFEVLVMRTNNSLPEGSPLLIPQ